MELLVKGAITRVGVFCDGAAGKIAGCCSRFCTSLSELCSGCSSVVAAARTSRMSSCWRCAISSTYCAARSGGASAVRARRSRSACRCCVPLCRGLLGFSLLVTPRTLLRWHQSLVRRKWRQLASQTRDGRVFRRRSGSSCCGSRARTQAGGIAGSAENSPRSASRHRRRVSGVCLPAHGSARGRRDAPGRAGASSCKRRRRASLPGLFSPSRRCSCAGRPRLAAVDLRGLPIRLVGHGFLALSG